MYGALKWHAHQVYQVGPRIKYFLWTIPFTRSTVKLPSNGQVLCVLFYKLRTGKLTVRISKTNQKRSIDFEQDAFTMLDKLHAEWRTLQKDRNKTSESVKNTTESNTGRLKGTVRNKSVLTSLPSPYIGGIFDTKTGLISGSHQ